MPYVEDYDTTILPLEYFRRLMGIDPYHFWQMEYTGHPMHGYSGIYPHARWMYTVDDVQMPTRSAKRGPARYDMLQAIASAELKVASISELNAWPGHKYNQDEEVRLDKPRQPILYRRTPFVLRTKWWRVQSVGTQTYSVIQADVVPVYIGDDVTITAVVDSIDAREVVVTYAGTEIKIRPITVTVSAGTATITLKRWQMGDPDDWDNVDTIDATVDGNLLGTVDVGRLYIDASDQILMAWEPGISMCGCLEVDDCVTCQLATQTACAVRNIYKYGAVGWQLGTYNETTEQYDAASYSRSRYPDLAYISYVHGMSNGADRYMAPKWQRAVAYMAAAELPDYVEDAVSQPEILYDWRKDAALADAQGKSKNVSQSDIGNPFGTRQGQIYAWKLVKQAIGDL